MCRRYLYLATLVSVMSTPAFVRADTEIAPATAGAQGRDRAHTENEGGFYTVLPEVNNIQLVVLLRNYHEALTRREKEITRYLDENQLDTKDALITIIMPGGLVYAAVKTANLEEARDELDELSEDLDELSRDLVVMRAKAGELTLVKQYR